MNTSNKIMGVVNGTMEDVDTRLEECKTLNIAMRSLISELIPNEMTVFERNIINNVTTLISIQEQTLNKLDAQNRNVMDELTAIARNVKKMEE